MEYVLVVVAIALVAAALVALKKHPEMLARIVALEQKIAGHQPVVVNVQAPAAAAATAAPVASAGLAFAGGGGGGGGGGGSVSLAPLNAAPVNPFIAWKAAGLTLYDAILRLTHYPNADEMDLAVAAGYERPVVPPAPAAPVYTPDPHNLDFVRDAQGAVAVTDYAQLTVPDGWRGTLLVQTNQRPGTLAYSTTLNGAYPQHRDPPDANNPYWLVYGVAPRPGDIVMTDRTVRLDVQQPAGATVAFDFQPYAVAA